MLPNRNPAILFQSLPDGAVLLDTAAEVYFGLDPVGARIWELLPPATRTLDELCDTLAREHPGVAPGTVRADVGDLLAQLVEAGLVHPATGCDGVAALAGPAS